MYTYIKPQVDACRCILYLPLAASMQTAPDTQQSDTGNPGVIGRTFNLPNLHVGEYTRTLRHMLPTSTRATDRNADNINQGRYIGTIKVDWPSYMQSRTLNKTIIYSTDRCLAFPHAVWIRRFS